MTYARQIRRWTSVEEEELAEAEVRLQQAKFEAVVGKHYDPDEFDAIVATYRAARARADQARWVARQQAESLARRLASYQLNDTNRGPDAMAA